MQFRSFSKIEGWNSTICTPLTYLGPVILRGMIFLFFSYHPVVDPKLHGWLHQIHLSGLSVLMLNIPSTWRHRFSLLLQGLENLKLVPFLILGAYSGYLYLFSDLIWCQSKVLAHLDSDDEPLVSILLQHSKMIKEVVKLAHVENFLCLLWPWNKDKKGAHISKKQRTVPNLWYICHMWYVYSTLPILGFVTGAWS